MKTKYFNYKTNKEIDLTQDGCELKDWGNKNNKSFSRHSDGFMIFLDSDDIGACDEYAADDPYQVENNINEEFHQVRIEQTINLLDVLEVNTNSKILDLACGEGHITNVINEKYSGAEVSGLDYSVSAIKYANKHFKGIDFIVGNAYMLPYSEGYFDVVVCNNIWEHVPDPLLLLSQIKKVLKKNGHIIISTPSRFRFRNIIRVLLGKPVVFMSEHHVTEYTVGQIYEQMRYGGFDIIKITSNPIKLTSAIQKSIYLLINQFIKLTRSNHKLESTVFYLAKRVS